MVIGPKEAEQLTPKQKAYFEHLVSEIDNSLLENYTGHTLEVAWVKEFPNVKVQNKLQHEYVVKAGWDEIDFQDDKEDGGYVIILKPPKESES